MDDNDKITLVSKPSPHHNGDAVTRRNPRLVESSGPESRYSVSDSGLNISPEEAFLLGSVKPRAGRRKRNALKEATSDTLHHVPSRFDSAKQPLTGPQRDRSFLETTL